MRLIDADSMIADNTLGIYFDTSNLDVILDIQPTAFDLEKVVEQLGEFKTTIWSDALGENVEVINLERAIKIVRRGGV